MDHKGFVAGDEEGRISYTHKLEPFLILYALV